jgi:hypothetical protein
MMVANPFRHKPVFIDSFCHWQWHPTGYSYEAGALSLQRPCLVAMMTFPRHLRHLNEEYIDAFKL